MFGIGSSFLLWCRSYFYDRKQFVKLNVISYNKVDLTSDVPQGIGFSLNVGTWYTNIKATLDQRTLYIIYTPLTEYS